MIPTYFIEYNDHIFIDTCSILSTGFYKYIDNNQSLFKELNKTLIITTGVLRELNCFTEKNTSRGHAARKALYEINGCIEKGIISVCDNQLRPDDYFLSFAAANREYKRICVITQDFALAKSLDYLNHDGVALHAHQISVKRIASNGYLSYFDMSKQVKTSTNYYDKTNAKELLNKILIKNNRRYTNVYQHYQY